MKRLLLLLNVMLVLCPATLDAAGLVSDLQRSRDDRMVTARAKNSERAADNL